ncbi:MAG: aryl-sulfate sulfotransferase, partial [bacterium]|nr:aryl-sulfate sulfotransferase [bacterium]
DPAKLEAEFIYSEKIVEVKPQGLHGAEEVWTWRLWDHLIQDFDSELPNFGSPRDHPRRVDLNYVRDAQADWIHMNAVDYHPEWDQLILSPRWFDELWIIDHSTTKEEAASSQGGRYGHGGDLLYRMGNPMSYGHGKLEDKLLFGQHNCMWIPEGFPGQGDVTVFNNGTSEPRKGYSSVEQFRLPVDEQGVYRLNANMAFEPPQVVWSYSRGEEMFSFRISGAERLANGNTLICSGDQPWLLEISPDKKVVWENRRQYGGGSEDDPKFENGAMFRAPGYSLEYFSEETQRKISALRP